MQDVSERITTEWLDHRLSVLFKDGESIKDFKVEDVGTGTGFAGTVLRVALTYDKQSSAPETVIVKLPIKEGPIYEMFQSSGVFFREAHFYKEVAPHLSTDVPHVYHVDIDEANNDFAIIMADLGDIKIPDRQTFTVEEAKLVLSAIARFHAHYWNHPLAESDWLKSPFGGDRKTMEQAAESIDQTLSYLKESPHDTLYVEECANAIKVHIPKMPEPFIPKPFTIVHGDFHGDNVHLSGSSVTIYDWQVVSKGQSSIDVANLLFSSMEPDVYVENKDAILKHYHQELLAAGVKKYPYKKLLKDYDNAFFSTMIKMLVAFGTVDLNVENGEELKEMFVSKMIRYFVIGDVLTYARRLPLLFFIMRIMNFLSRK